MVVTVFPRQEKHTSTVLFTGPKIFFSVFHALIGPLISFLLEERAGLWFMKILSGVVRRDFETQPVDGDRVTFFVAFSTLYGLRWALGAFTTNAGNHMPWKASFQVVVMHTLLYVLPMTISSTTNGGLPKDLNGWDYFAAGLSILAGVFQQGSELQRLLFKRNPENRGKLHTSGLFHYARYINHTGHFLQDVALAIVTRSYVVAIFALMGIPLFCYSLTPETEAHMKNKYKEKYDAYIKVTPYKFIPYVW